MSGLTVCAPLRIEARMVRRGLRAAGVPAGSGGTDQIQVIRTGYGPVRAAASAARIGRSGAGALAVCGVGGSLTAQLRTGDLVVASEVSDGTTTVSCPSAPLLAAELRRAGLRAVTGPVVTVDRLVRQNHAALAASGAIAVDMESAPLVAGAGTLPAVVVRAISDTPDHQLVSPSIVTGGIAALRSLRKRRLRSPAGLRQRVSGRCCWPARGHSAPGWSGPSRSSSWR